MKKRLSLIIPTYNSEKSIGKTLNAIINQTIFEDIEVIVIDDGSVDSTVEVVSDFICTHSNINMI
ncbi:MAG: glycosyltransferase, partial [Ruminococcus flavefaciens]|nr:glycosyltransferase [Ruminococcus flavefaciens]